MFTHYSKTTLLLAALLLSWVAFGKTPKPTGTLKVDADEQHIVLVDGNLFGSRGTTPTGKQKLKAGFHVLRIFKSDKNHCELVRIKEGENKSIEFDPDDPEPEGLKKQGRIHLSNGKEECPTLNQSEMRAQFKKAGISTVVLLPPHQKISKRTIATIGMVEEPVRLLTMPLAEVHPKIEVEEKEVEKKEEPTP